MKYADAVKIHCENLREFSARAELSEAQKKNSVRQLAKLYKESRGGEDLISVYRGFKALSPDISLSELAEFCMVLTNELSKKDRKISQRERNNNANVAAGAHGKVSVVRNEYNERAFSEFSKIITHAKAVYTTSFDSAFEAVTDGKCEYCISPVESSKSGRLFGFYSLLDRSELKICAACTLDSENESIRYALIGNSFPDRAKFTDVTDLEFSVISDEGSFPSDIPRALPIFGAEIIKLDSLPLEYNNIRQKYFFTLRLPAENLRALHLYLSAEHEQYSPIGAYPTV